MPSLLPHDLCHGRSSSLAPSSDRIPVELFQILKDDAALDETQEHDRLLVATLHEIALRSNGRLASVLHDAACTLDGYRAGLTLATPNPLTGYRLVSTAVSDLDFAPTSSLCHDEEELA